MWQDSDLILQLLDSRQLASDHYPRTCPVCQHTSAHVYFHRFTNKRRGSGWAWCSDCGCYSHVSCSIPEWWKNLPLIDIGLLSASPEYLEGMKESIDHHFNALL
ncbi:hypothetical protein IJT17_02375 [bacterium]|nr:hypothetical protein [bacterium]